MQTWKGEKGPKKGTYLVKFPESDQFIENPSQGGHWGLNWCQL